MSSKKQMIVNLFANVIAFGVQFGVNFFLTPYIINSLGSEAYSFIPLTNNIVGYTTIITAAFYSMTGRFIAIAINKGDVLKAEIYLTSSTVANCVLSLILVIPSVLVTLNAEHVINIPNSLIDDVKITFAFSFVNMFISLVLSAYGAVFYATNRMDLSARKNIEGNIIRAILLICLFVFLAPKIYYINATMLVVTMYLIWTNIRYMHRLLPDLHFSFINFRLSAVKELLMSGIWNSLNQASSILLTSLDLFLANIFVGSALTGVYSVAKTVPNFVQSILGALVPVFIPQFMVFFARGENRKMIDSISFAVRIMGFICAVPIGFLLVFGRDFFASWVPTQNANMLHGLSVITLLGLMVTCAPSVIGDIFTVTNRLKIPALALLIAGVINSVAVVLMMRFTSLGIWSIPICSLLVSIGRGLIFMPIYAARCLHVRTKVLYPAVLRSFACMVTMVVVCLVSRWIIPGMLNGWLKIVFVGIICTIVACLLNLFIGLDSSDRQQLHKMIIARLNLKK
ncbi:MATE family efflux transporter [Bifidobacterium adolescentis]|uniref:MATE family efflux transporter n=1 Tax=Bifidobacterium adolescentis TaxID=1680 RepID=UPI002EB9BDED|nr:MATE family efflux transporter [Bifidobacterium longum]